MANRYSSIGMEQQLDGCRVSVRIALDASGLTSSALWQLRSTRSSFMRCRKLQTCAGPSTHASSVKCLAMFCRTSSGRLSRLVACNARALSAMSCQDIPYISTFCILVG